MSTSLPKHSSSVQGLGRVGADGDTVVSIVLLRYIAYSTLRSNNPTGIVLFCNLSSDYCYNFILKDFTYEDLNGQGMGDRL